jgi:dTDP-4-amino-4,6-dideoxygalactose transaminase
MIETYRTNVLGKKIYELLMTAKSSTVSSQKVEDIFYKNVKQPDELFFKIFRIQQKKFEILHTKRKKNALCIIDLLNKDKLVDCFHGLDLSIVEPSFTKLNIWSEKFNIPALIKKLNDVGIEAKHLEHKYGSVYQERLDRIVMFKDFSSLYECKNYFDIHDHFISLPLYENMDKVTIKKVVNAIKKIVN